MTGYSIHYIKANCYRFRVTDWSWRKLPIYVHRCPTHQCMYAHVSSNLRTRRRQVIHLESSKDGHPLERKDFVHSKKHCSACLVHGVRCWCDPQCGSQGLYLLFVTLIENVREIAIVLDANDFIARVLTASRSMDVLSYGPVIPESENSGVWKIITIE
jgi:hypothetical protein